MNKEYFNAISAIIAIVVIVAITMFVINYNPSSIKVETRDTNTLGSATASVEQCINGNSCITASNCPGICVDGVCEIDKSKMPRQVCGCQDGKFLEYVHCSDGKIHCEYC